MTRLLEEAFAEAARLCAAEQDAFSRFVVAELQSEAKWAEAFASSQDEVAGPAKEAAAEHKAGRTQPF